MFSKKTRNLTVAVLALVMALTLSFGLFGFNTQANAAGDHFINLSDTSATASPYEWSFGELKCKNYSTVYVEVPFLGNGTIAWKCKSANSGRFLYLKHNVNGSWEKDTSRSIVMAKSYHEVSFTSDDVYESAGKYYLGFTTTDDFKGIGVLLNITPSAKTFTVDFDTNGGEGTFAQMSYTEDNTGITLPIPTRTGYMFAGWYNGTTKVETPYAPTANVTLTAQWTANTYKIMVGETEVGTVTYDGDLPATVGEVTAEAGKTFNGYYVLVYGAKEFYYNANREYCFTGEKKYTTASDLVLTADWIDPNITYTANWAWNENNEPVLTLNGSDGHTETIIGTTNRVEGTYKAPTCTEVGTETLSATATYANETYTMPAELQKTFEIAALGHTMTTIAAVAPTCEVPGNNAYYYCETCKLFFKDNAGNIETTAEAEVVNALGHNYQTATWKWQGYESATATFSCANDANHTKNVNGTIEVVNSTATCEKFGSVSYTATATLEGVTVTDNKNTPLQKHTVDENGICTVCGAYSVIFDTTGNTSKGDSFKWDFPANWKDTATASDTKACGGDPATIPASFTASGSPESVHPIALGNNGGKGKMTYTLPVAKNYITKVVVYAGACDGSKTSGVQVTVGSTAYTAQNVPTGKEIDVYPFEVNQKGAETVTVANSGTAKLYVYAVDIYYADYAVTVVDGATQNVAYVSGAEYTLPVQAGVTGYDFVGWWNGAEFLANTTLTLTQDMTVTAVYAKLDALGVGFRTYGTPGVRYGFVLRFNGLTVEEINANMALLTSVKFTLYADGKAGNPVELTGANLNYNYSEEFGGLVSNLVLINVKPEHCTPLVKVEATFTFAGKGLTATSEEATITSKAQAAYDAKDLDAEMAEMYGVNTTPTVA